MTLPKIKTYIKCKSCWKEIEKKAGREYCIKCRNQMDKERQRGYREQPWYREKYNERKREQYWEEKTND